jgi:hypothetical protein
MADDDPYDPLDPLGTFPQTAWSDDDPGRLIEERLALVALADRAARVPPSALLEVTAALEDPLGSWRAGTVVHDLRRGLAEAAQFIAEAPWGTAAGMVTVRRDARGAARVIPHDDLAVDEFFRVARQLALASWVGLTDAPVELDWLPLQLAANDNRAAPPPIEPGAFMFMGTNETPEGDRLWLYKHVVTRRWLNLDAESRAWRFDPSSSRYVRCDDLAASLADIGASGVHDGQGAGL